MPEGARETAPEEPFSEGWLDRQIARSVETMNSLSTGLRESMGRQTTVDECAECGVKPAASAAYPFCSDRCERSWRSRTEADRD